MTGFHIDQGTRCDRHVGELFAPRCLECDALATDDSSELTSHLVELNRIVAPADKYGYCTIHRDYPSTPALPCLRCVEESREAL